MQVAERCVVSIHYTLTNDAGEVLDSSQGGDALAYLHGHGNIIQGLESALAGHQAGETLEVRIEPAQAYGERDERLIQDVPRRAFQGINEVKEGMRFQTQGSNGPASVVVTQVQGDTVTVDGNHPLAGQPLNFKVEITEVRPASDDEVAHGHAHGAGGHAH